MLPTVNVSESRDVVEFVLAVIMPAVNIERYVWLKMLHVYLDICCGMEQGLRKQEQRG